MAGLFAGDRVAATSSASVPTDEVLRAGVRQLPAIDAFATKAGKEASVMVWNYHEDDLTAASSEVNLAVSGIPSGIHKVLLEHYRIDQNHSNAFTVWQAMGSPQSPTPEQYAQLRAARTAPNLYLAGVARCGLGRDSEDYTTPAPAGHLAAPPELVKPCANSFWSKIREAQLGVQLEVVGCR